MKADLHLHSTASDGTLEPDELVALAAEMGFTYLALTDHDSVEGILRAQDEARDWRDADPRRGAELRRAKGDSHSRLWL